ncbi:MAG: glycosyl hydrolase family 8 [Candidatus Microsaccharimonas sp.]
MKKIIISLLIIIVLGLIGVGFYTAYQNKIKSTNDAPLVFANNRMLLELWSRYKQTTLEPDSLRALDKTQNSITTSEGQSYTMMRAVWMDDIDTFETSWNWTKQNLQREDKLMSWKYGERPDGTYGVLTEQGGQNAASDADTDIALALIMAANRWREQTYLDDARDIIDAVWENEIVTINGKPILVANDLEKNNTESVIVNPSYLSPYAYKVFQKIDKDHDWNAVVDSSYEILLDSADAPLDKGTGSGLTPDWIRIDRSNGAIIPAPEYTSNYGYEAIRTPWRMALDWKWYNDGRAKEVLQKYTQVIGKNYAENGKLAAVYTHDGLAAVDYESPAMYGTIQSYYDVVDPEAAKAFYEKQLLTYYEPDTQSWKEQLAYYDDNWVWFGMALHNDVLINLTEQTNE